MSDKPDDFLERDDWRDYCRRLDYPDREIYVLYEADERIDHYAPPEYRHCPPLFTDFDPQPNDPSPDVWPLDELDPGDDPIDQLYCRISTIPEPNVRWVTDTYQKAAYRGENPLSPRDLGVTELELRKYRRLYCSSDTLSLTGDRTTFFDRLSRLWNGEVVQDHHLLADKLPSWQSLFGDLDQDELHDIHTDLTDSDLKLYEKWGHYDWYDETNDVFVKPQYILRKTVKYAPTTKGKTLINGRKEFQDLIGDKFEGLKHRFGVGLATLLFKAGGWETESYAPLNDQSILDLMAGKNLQIDAPNQWAFVEVLTEHKNYENYRKTYQKLAHVNKYGRPIVVFDTRKTAYRVMNHWHKRGLGTLPTGEFTSSPRIDWVRKKTHEAYQRGDWDIAEWFTIDRLWRETIGSDDFDLSRNEIISTSW